MSKLYFVMFVFIPSVGILLFLAWRSSRILGRFQETESRTVSGGFEAARVFLNHLNYFDIRIERGEISQASVYDFRTKTVVLSPFDYESRAITAVGRALHRCGHAAEHMHGNVMALIQGCSDRTVRWGGRLSLGLIPLSFLPGFGFLFPAGTFLFSFYVAFVLMMFPFEVLACRRVIKGLAQMASYPMEELKLMQKVLESAVTGSLAKIFPIFLASRKSYAP